MSTRRNHRRLDKIEQKANGDPDTGPWIVFGPKWAQDTEGADPPSDDLSDPVWARGKGWMEKADAPIHEGERGPLALYAPDSMDEIAGSE